MKPRFAIGNSTFSKLRREGAHFVDKSLLIADIIQNPQEVILLPRPRRFGKTLALTMLQAWFEPGADNEGLFRDLAVWQAGDDVRAQFGRHPVIRVSFKDVKERDWLECRARIAREIGECAAGLKQAYGTSDCPPDDLPTLTALVGQTASNVQLGGALKLLCRWLHAATGQNAVVLIDEYDTPIIAGWTYGYYDEAIGFFRDFFSSGLKDNARLYRGVLTGILRIAKESLFSGLNNLTAYSAFSQRCNDRFGFTPAEVRELVCLCELESSLPSIERWYNGYDFGGQTIYNPWSVLNFLDSPQTDMVPYWVNTASDEPLRDLLVRRNPIGLDDWQTLLAGGSVRRAIDENMVLRGIETNASAVWSLLLFSGYLTARNPLPQGLKSLVDLRIPNVEVRLALTAAFENHFVASVGGAGTRAQQLCTALVAGEVEVVEDLLGELAVAMLSYHDVAQRPAEAVYQAFVLGLMATLESTHEVTSNREAGHGRYDVLVCPKQAGGAGAVLELKVPRSRSGETAEMALTAAEAQLRQRDYAVVLRKRGASSVVQWALVFAGKRVWVRKLK